MKIFHCFEVIESSFFRLMGPMMDKIDSYLHDLEHLYYDGKSWAQHATIDDVLQSKILHTTNFPLLNL